MMSNRDKTFMWDHFVDYCEAKGLDCEAEDFDGWCDALVDEAIDEAVWGV